MEIAIDEIVVGKRHRKDLGDVRELADSIEKIGLLHPVVLLPDKTLVVGERRLAAFKMLGRDRIPANIGKNLEEIQTLLTAECDENTCRKAFLPTEFVALGESMENVAAKLAKEAQKKAAGGDRKSEKAKDQGGKSLTTLIKPRDNSKRAAAIVAKAVGVSHVTYERAKEVVKSGDVKAIEKMNRDGKVNGAHKIVKRNAQIAEIKKEEPPMPKGPFRVIAIDPPWKYDAREDDETHRASNPYPSMTIEEIGAMDISGLAHTDCVLWMWTTNAHLPESFAIVKGWGFTYKTLLTWAKDRMGTGDWLRGKTEHCLMCVRGKPVINLTNQTTLLEGPMRKHSQKPDEFYAMVDALCPGSKVEIFSRTERDGWTTHGDERGSI